MIFSPYLRVTPKKGYTLLIMTLVSMIVFGVFAIRPSLVTVATLKKQVADLESVNESMKLKVQNLATAQIIYLENKPHLYLVDASMPDENVVPQFIQDISTKVALAGSSLEAIKVTKGGKNEDLLEYQISMSVACTYPQLTGILTFLEKSLLTSNVTSVSVRPHQKGAYSIQAEINVSLYQYEGN